MNIILVPNGLSQSFSVSSFLELLLELSKNVVVALLEVDVKFEVLSLISDDVTAVVFDVDDDVDDKVEAISEDEDWTVVVMTDCCWNVFSKSKSASSKYFVYFLLNASELTISGLEVYSVYVRVTVDVIGIGTDFAFSEVIVVTIVVVVVSGRAP